MLISKTIRMLSLLLVIILSCACPCFGLAFADTAGLQNVHQYTPGEYTAKSPGFGGYVVVTLTIDESGRINEVNIKGDQETPDVGGLVMEEYRDIILEAQSADIDTYTTATLTSKAIIEATKLALESASAKPELQSLYKPGEYTAKSPGFGGYVAVTLTIDEGGRISEVQIKGDQETPDVGGLVMEEYRDIILEAQSADIDTYTTATLTSKAIIEATKLALESASAKPELQSLYKPGEYTAKSPGFGGYVIVTLVIDEGGRISEVQIKGDQETPDVGGLVMEEYQDMILEAQSADIDTYTTATLTSKAIIEATKLALDQAR